MPSGPPLNFSNFSGGLNLLDAPDLIADNEARDLLNVQGTTAGAISKRTGLVLRATPANVLRGLHSFEKDNTGLLLVGFDSANLYSFSSVFAISTRKTGLTGGNWECVNAPAVGAQGPLYMMNGGSSSPLQWDGVAASASAWTATDAGGTVPNGQYCIYAKNQVFVAGASAFLSRVYWSALSDPTGWNAANLAGAGSMDLDPSDGMPITGLGTVGPYILVGKQHKLWVIIDAGTATARQLSTGIGIASHRSIAAAPEGTYFLGGDRRVYLTNGSTLKPISDKIRPMLEAIPAGNIATAAGAYYNGHYYLSVCSGQGPFVNDVTLDYDTVLGSWWKHGFGVYQFAVWHSGLGLPALLYGASAQQPYLDQCFAPGVYQDRGVNFPWAWYGPWQSPSFYRRRLYPSTWYRKRLRQIRIQGFGTIDYSLAKDFVTPETLIRSNIVPSTPPNGMADIFSLGVARAFSQVFSATSNTQDEVLSYTMALTDRVDRWD